MGVEQFYISGLEAGRRNSTIVTVWHAAEALDIKAGKLFDDGRDEPKPVTSKRRQKGYEPPRRPSVSLVQVPALARIAVTDTRHIGIQAVWDDIRAAISRISLFD